MSFLNELFENEKPTMIDDGVPSIIQGATVTFSKKTGMVTFDLSAPHKGYADERTEALVGLLKHIGIDAEEIETQGSSESRADMISRLSEGKEGNEGWTAQVKLSASGASNVYQRETEKEIRPLRRSEVRTDLKNMVDKLNSFLEGIGAQNGPIVTVSAAEHTRITQQQAL